MSMTDTGMNVFVVIHEKYVLNEDEGYEDLLESNIVYIFKDEKDAVEYLKKDYIRTVDYTIMHDTYNPYTDHDDNIWYREISSGGTRYRFLDAYRIEQHGIYSLKEE